MPEEVEKLRAFDYDTVYEYMKTMSTDFSEHPEQSSFDSLIRSIQFVDQQMASRASRAVNTSLTLRNWLIGFYIQEYEQNGRDRAEYGVRLIPRLAVELKAVGVSRSEVRELRRYRKFYQTYPQIRESLTPEVHNLLPDNRLQPPAIRESPTPVSGPDLFSGCRLRTSPNS